MKAQMKKPSFDKLIDYINTQIPKKSTDAAILLAFESIDAMDRAKKWEMFLLADFMEETQHPDYEKFDTFFKKYATVSRKIIERSQLLKDNLYLINKNHFEDTSKILNPDYYHIYQPRIFNYDIAFNAYMACLDFYDCNINKNQWTSCGSLVKFENGVLKGVYLGDTMDRDIFWGSVDKQVAALPKFKRKKVGFLNKLLSK